MAIATLFMDGDSQAVNMPGELAFAGRHDMHDYHHLKTGGVILSARPPLDSEESNCEPIAIER